MAEEKKFRLSADDVQQIVDPDIGGAYASDHIVVDGKPVGVMYRDEPENELDSGWRFLSGEESQEYLDDPENLGIYAVNTIANYDRAIVPHLQRKVGTLLERIAGTHRFREEP